ncbi:MAG: hypothetical protein IKN12_05730 [Selenomonadaceae bacterium]|nr:hypothetical protein [Selenomonadaceae bacterium]
MKQILSSLLKSSMMLVIGTLIITLNSAVTYANNKICYVYNGTVNSLVGEINNLLIEKGQKNLCLTPTSISDETQSVYLVPTHVTDEDTSKGAGFLPTVSFFHDDGKNVYKIHISDGHGITAEDLAWLTAGILYTLGMPGNEISKIGNDVGLDMAKGLVILPYKKVHKVWVPEVGKYFVVETAIENGGYIVQTPHLTQTITAKYS